MIDKKEQSFDKKLTTKKDGGSSMQW